MSGLRSAPLVRALGRSALITLITLGALALPGACAPASPLAASHGGPRTSGSAQASASSAASSSSASAASSAMRTPPTPLELAALDEGPSWPPAAIAPVIDTPEPGEGEWAAVEPPWMHKLANAPPALYRTFVRPDRARPKSRILLVEMDARQLDFDMEPGLEDPRFVVGGRVKKEGRLPRTKEVATRVVAAWNGGFRTEHGFYGVMMKKHVFIPPVPHAAAVVVMEDGRFGFGTWGPDATIEPGILSFRQNLDPLLADGVLNPRGRPRWGGILQAPGQSGDQTKRSGMCLTHAHHVIYGWGNDVGPAALAKGLQLAGCQYALHLDMNPIHTGFLFMSFDDDQYKKGKTEALALPMGGINKRFVEPNPKDFFYAMLRDVSHPTAGRTATLSGSLAWAPDEGAQPAPTWSPSIWRARSGDVDVRLFERDRVGFALRLGEGERALPGSTPAVPDARTTLAGEPARRAIASICLGVARDSAPLGVTIDGVVAIASASAGAAMNTGSLFVDAHGELAITAGEASDAPRATSAPSAPSAPSVMQGPLLVRDGAPLGGLATATRDRVGLGLTREGHVLVAHVHGGEDALAAALVEAGAQIAIGGRGDGDESIARAGGDAKLWARHASTTLFVLARTMSPRAFRWDRDAEGAPRWPEWKTPIP